MTSGELPAEFGMAWIGVGVLRLRKTFASRRSCCAQDDSSLRMTGLWSMRSYAFDSAHGQDDRRVVRGWQAGR
jgi:hypothetical protein